MPTHTVFYSWQSDLPNATNRGFIQDALERAAKDIRKDEEIGIDPSIDRDTQGVPGSPNIVATIFEKIGRADVFVADVSFITPPGYGGRPTPNPNVLIELGYAANRHGWNRILCVFNAATGRVEDLPFDIRQHSVTGYSLAEGQEKAEVRKALVAQLRDKIRLILTTPDASVVRARTEFNSELVRIMIDILIYGDEYAPGSGGRPIRDIQGRFEMASTELRRLASGDAAHDLGLAEEMNQLAELLDSTALGMRHAALGDSFEGQVAEAMRKASELKDSCLKRVPLDDASLKQVRELLGQTQRELAALAARADTMVRGRQSDLKASASELGGRLLRLGHYNLDRLTPGLGERLRQIGRKLHLAEFAQVFLSGEGIERLLGPIRDGSAELTEVVNSLPKVR